VSQFLTKQWQVGLVGYLYQQIGCDSGSGDRVGCFQSRVVGVGPQIGYIFPVGDTEPEGLRRVRQRKSASGLEPLADVQPFACVQRRLRPQGPCSRNRDVGSVGWTKRRAWLCLPTSILPNWFSSFVNGRVFLEVRDYLFSPR
jgi:hypothetical protein